MADCAAGLHTGRCRRRCMDEGCDAPASGLSLASGSEPKDNLGTKEDEERKRVSTINL